MRTNTAATLPAHRPATRTLVALAALGQFGIGWALSRAVRRGEEHEGR